MFTLCYVLSVMVRGLRGQVFTRLKINQLFETNAQALMPSRISDNFNNKRDSEGNFSSSW
jgi:hypothetical protein